MPEITLLTEERAQGKTKEIFDDIKDTLGTPFIHPFFNILAPFELYFQKAWEQLKPNITHPYFETLSSKVRFQLEDSIKGNFFMPDHIINLVRLGLQDHKREVQRVVGFFYYQNANLILLSSCLNSALIGSPVGGSVPLPRGRYSPPEIRQILRKMEIPLIGEEEIANQEKVGEICTDIQATLNTLYLPPDFRALARWPAYLEYAWTKTKPYLTHRKFAPLKQQVKDFLSQGIRDLPYPIQLSEREVNALGVPREQTEQLKRLLDHLHEGMVSTALALACLKVGLSIKGI